MSDQPNFTRLSQAIGLLGDTLRPYVERELKRAGGNWWTDYVLPAVSPLTRQKLPSLPKRGVNGQLGPLDVADLLSLITRNWAAAFRGKLPDSARSWAEELRNSRNDWAHKASGDVSAAIADRAIDTAALLLDAVEPAAAAAMRLLKDQPAAAVPAPLPAAQATTAPLPGPVAALEPPSAPKAAPAVPAAASAVAPSFPDAGLRPWREVVTPRADVRTGTLTQSQFAADLHEVFRQTTGVGPEYTDPREFFERTYVTSGIRDFLKTALRRLTNQGGDPVVQLKTGFGGGKTHTMLALYHMARSGAEIVDDVPVLKELSAELGVALPKANVAVLVGTKLSATAPYEDDPELKSLGISLKTLWGHMAWQLGGWKAYQVVQTADDAAVAPGEELRTVLAAASPCIILIDELVAYGRNLPTRRGQVPGGTLESLLTFLQTLTEIAKATPGVIVAASIPESDMEIGGPQGQQVLARIQQTFGRMETAWQPVQPTESFEVVRRRLFESVPADGRDQAVAAFVRYYRTNASDFPAEVQEKAYEERMKSAYPFHPELFDRLYQDWNGAVPEFQSTRGVLRLLAGAVQAMWRELDPSALIMPATLRFDLPVVREELMRYLPPPFQAVIDSDIEGATSEALQIDASNPRFGKVGAARAAARTILLGSVPGKATPGLEDVRIRLGAARPGESVATYNDVLGRLRDRLQFLHGSGSRYWFEVRPNLNKTVADRISRIADDDVYAFVLVRLKEDGDRALFAGKHVAPATHADVPDDTSVRLVVVSPRFSHKAGTDDSPALAWSKDVLDHRANSPRLNRNMLVFAAFDEESHAPLVESAKSYLAWKSIVDEKRQLNLDENQVRQATEGRDKAQQSVDALLGEGYRWALFPQRTAVEDQGKWKVAEETWAALDTSGRLGSTGTLARRIASALQQEERLLEAWSPMFLKRELDRWFWPQGVDHISVKKLWEENLTRYVYFPRLRDRDVFMKAVQEGATTRDFFGYAVGLDYGKYVGLSFGQRPASILLDDASLIVRKEVAETTEPARVPGATSIPGKGGPEPTPEPVPPRARVMRRFYGSVKLNELKVSSGAGQVADEVVKHLAGLVDADVEVVLEIHAKAPEGFPDAVIRTVSENAKTLKFQTFEFEEE
ncbi:MAG: ATP-binding protein [Chloroflexi bacterium]|nr:ATP-binding protein [Chloroflexota bacterium]